MKKVVLRKTKSGKYQAFIKIEQQFLIRCLKSGKRDNLCQFIDLILNCLLPRTAMQASRNAILNESIMALIGYPEFAISHSQFKPFL